GINQRLFSGIIATMTPHQDTLGISAVDVIEELKTVGTQYFRNHYLHDGLREGSLPAFLDTNTGRAYIGRRNRGAILHGTAKLALNQPLSRPRYPIPHLISPDPAYTYAEMEYDFGGDFIVGPHIRIWLGSGGMSPFTFNIDVYADDDGIFERIGGLSLSGMNRNMNHLDIPISASRTSILKIVIGVTVGRISLHVNRSPPGILKLRPTGGEISESVGSFAFSATIAKFHDITGDNTILNDNPVYRIDRVITGDGERSPRSGDFIPVFPRGFGQWMEEGYDMQASDIIHDILDANGYRLINSDAPLSDLNVNLFRCGGDFIYNYLTTIADMHNTYGSREGHQNVIAGDLWNDDSVIFSKRLKASDEPRFHLCYAPQDPDMEKIWIKSFRPEMTMARKPVTSMIQGTDENELPIMLALTDVGRLRKQGEIMTSSAELDNNVSSVIDAARIAYADVIRHSGSQWSGEIELSGIHNAFMPESEYKGFIDVDDVNPHDTFGSGVPITITDSRYDMDNEKVLVHEVTYDFRDLTTKLQISNYSLLSSNLITDNARSSKDAGNAALDANNESLQIRQFLYLMTDANTTLDEQANAATVDVRLTNGQEKEFDATVIKMPDLNSTLLHAFLPVDSSFAEMKHAVEAVRYDDNPWIELRRSQRVDKGPGQSLTINIQIKHRE
ncbi:MAG: hypothetical protein FWD92_06990, partial [Methanomassiliicoccaceae archaeon]|nr:hypothetical protein [Methanomassiliicoccaceae archaeon]